MKMRVYPINYLKKFFISTSATTCTKYLLEENDFDEKLKVSQDYELWLRLSLKYILQLLRSFRKLYYS